MIRIGWGFKTWLLATTAAHTPKNLMQVAVPAYIRKLIKEESNASRTM